MLQGLFTEIVESLLIAAGHAVVEFLGWKQAAEFVGAVVGLACIVIGIVIWRQGS